MKIGILSIILTVCMIVPLLCACAKGGGDELDIFVNTSSEVFENADIIKEVAYAYRRQFGQIEYDQYNSRRHISPSPEDATPQHQIYLDCSSYVNVCYLEAFGVNILPSDIELKPSTKNFEEYARENKNSADVVGYWVPADYPTSAEKIELAKSIKEMLQVGDVLVYRHGTEGTTKGHCYIYVGDDTFLHRPGAGSYTVVAENPAASYENSPNEKTSSIKQESFDSIFYSESSSRYIFKSTKTDTVKNFFILRPLIRNLTPTEETVNRMSIKGFVMEKTASVWENTAVRTGDEIKFRVTVENTNTDAAKEIILNDELPVGTEFISGSEGVKVKDGKLSFKGEVPADDDITIEYTVKVTETKAGALIESKNTYVSGVKLGDITYTVSNYSDEQIENFSKIASDYVKNGKTFNSKLEMVSALFNEVGVQKPDQYESTQKMLDDLIDTEKLTRRSDTEISKIIVPNLYGGMDICEGTFKIPDNDRARLVSEGELAAGDIIVAEWSGGDAVYVYLGKSQLLTLNENGMCEKLTIGKNIYGTDADNILVSLIAYDRYAVLRPSMKG